MDLSILESINGDAYRHAWLADVAKFLADDGVYLMLAIVAVLFLAARRHATPQGRRGASAAGFAALLALGVGQLVSAAVDRARPFVTHPHEVHLLIPHARDAGFPSDHATGGFAIAAALLLRHRPAGLVALVLAAAIAVARVAVGAHYPSDVAAGAALGTATALVLFLAPLRLVTDRIADVAGACYERLLAAVLRRPAPVSR